ncbi:VWA domain-containing protein [Streptomyces sp. CAI-85]|nr:VWA domain-containing protein [Streptomyces sp. CAI-85]
MLLHAFEFGGYESAEYGNTVVPTSRNANLDDDGVVPTVFFDTDAHPVVDIGLDDHVGRVAAIHDALGHMGTTDYARKLDELAVPRRRVVDNAGFFAAGKDPKRMSDAVLYDRLMGEFPDWLVAARAAGILAVAGV